MSRLKLPLFFYLLVVVVLSGCSSGKSAFEHGNYYEAVLTSVNRLRRNDDHAKSIETLRQAYPMAVQFYEDRAKASLASNADFKWSVVVESYTTINVMYDEIRRCPGALKVIPNPLNYYAKLDEAKKNAAEENYAAGITAMTFATRDKAKSAYYLFKKANEYVPGYKDVIKMTETALWNATVKVVMEPIPVQAKNISVSAQFFDDKVSEYVHSAPINEFVKFYTRKEAQTMKLKPDHIIKIDFDEFVVGQVFMNEKEIKLEKDSVVVGSYVTQSATTGTKGSSSGTTGGTSGTTGSNTSGTSGTGSYTSGTTGSNTSGTTGSNTSGTTGGTSGTTGGSQGTSTTGTSGTGTSGTTGSNTSGTTGGTSDGKSNTSEDNDSEKVTICHIPPGNEGNRHTLVISRSALKAHLAHGDKEGACDTEKDKGKDKAPKDDKSKEDKAKDEKPADDKAKDDKAKDEKPADDKSKEDKAKDEKSGDDKAKDDKAKDEKPVDDKSKEDKAKDEKSGDDKSKDEKAKDEKPADDKAKDEKPADDKSKEDKAKDEKSGDDKSKDEKPADDKAKDEKPADDKSKDEKPADDKSKDEKPKDEKPKDDKSKDKGKKPNGTASANREPVFFASASNDPAKWLAYTENNYSNDTVKIYTTVKATLYYYKKTTTSKGVITFRIIDAKTNALLSVEKMPGEYIWVSEWATFNGDERALSPEQLQLTKQRERTPPPAQDLFIEFARPIYDQVVNKIKNFYTGY